TLVTNDGTHTSPWASDELTTTEMLNTEGTVNMTPIVDTLWPDGTLGFLGGPAQGGESSYGRARAGCLAHGGAVVGPDRVAAQKRVLFIEEEDEQAKVNERYRALARQHGADPDAHHDAPIWFWIGQGFQLNRAECLDWLRRVIEKYGLDVVYLDALWRMVGDN